jgi:hypothetical protein
MNSFRPLTTNCELSWTIRSVALGKSKIRPHGVERIEHTCARQSRAKKVPLDRRGLRKGPGPRGNTGEECDAGDVGINRREHMPIEILWVESKQGRTGISGFTRSFLNATSLSGFPQHRSAANCRARSISSCLKGNSVPTQSKVGIPLIIRKYPTRRSNSTIARGDNMSRTGANAHPKATSRSSPCQQAMAMLSC